MGNGTKHLRFGHIQSRNLSVYNENQLKPLAVNGLAAQAVSFVCDKGGFLRNWVGSLKDRMLARFGQASALESRPLFRKSEENLKEFLLG